MSSQSLRLARTAAYENSRPELRRHVPETATRALDLGCATGAVGAALKEAREIEVVGIENDPAYARDAAARLDEVIAEDLEALAADPPALRARLGSFDCLIAGDVLEHLREPWAALRAYAELLRAGGTAIVSLPNVRFWEAIWQLAARGTWPRRSEGIFDRDHLRWFTVGDGLDLVRSAGLTPVELDRRYRLSTRAPLRGRYAPLLARTPIRPFLTFQFVIVARRP